MFRPMQNLNEPYLLQQRRKLPRVGLVSSAMRSDALAAVRLLWEDRSQSEVLDLSLTGVVLRNQGLLREKLQRAKVGTLFSANLSFFLKNQEERLVLDLRLLHKDSEQVSARIESLNSEGRLCLHQDLKDQIIINNFRGRQSLTTALLPEVEFHGWNWYHSAFDTNFLIQRKNEQIQAMILEYDTLILRFDNQGSRLRKSFAMIEEGQSYSYYWTEASFVKSMMKVSMGASWAERLRRVLHQAATTMPSSTESMSKDFKSAENFLQALRG